ncbi:transport and Golgi organization protein 1 homolog [Equus quagga]|uniref:transport and Golgi organization protein 1 homolog n=1 Tax=Equus quagga TaxID=89248 RepID=UPI001EE262A2|nr:transport and Golgi organization protein 1 homolog [Equus quagga]
MTQKMAMLQEEPVIVKPMPGRPNMQNAPRRGSMDGPLPRPRWSSEASGKPSAPDAGSGAAPTMNSGSRSSSPAKVTEEGKQTVPQEPEGPSVPSITSLAEPPGAVSPSRLRAELVTRAVSGKDVKSMARIRFL